MLHVCISYPWISKKSLCKAENWHISPAWDNRRLSPFEQHWWLHCLWRLIKGFSTVALWITTNHKGEEKRLTHHLISKLSHYSWCACCTTDDYKAWLWHGSGEQTLSFECLGDSLQPRTSFDLRDFDWTQQWKRESRKGWTVTLLKGQQGFKINIPITLVHDFTACKAYQPKSCPFALLRSIETLMCFPNVWWSSCVSITLV